MFTIKTMFKFIFHNSLKMNICYSMRNSILYLNKLMILLKPGYVVADRPGF